jgi:hypothetical protein
MSGSSRGWRLEGGPVMADLGGGVYVIHACINPPTSSSRTQLSPCNLLAARETVVVVQVSVRIEIEDGATLDLSAGDLASLPRGAITTWHPAHDFVKVWLSG